MRPKTFYRNSRLRYLYVYVNFILETTPKEQKVNVSWWRQDEKTGKLISMDIQQDMWVKSTDNEWVPLDDVTAKRIQE